jgi:hypothetical protein
VKNSPHKERFENFWREIHEDKVMENGEACRIKD